MKITRSKRDRDLTNRQYDSWDFGDEVENNQPILWLQSNSFLEVRSFQNSGRDGKIQRLRCVVWVILVDLVGGNERVDK